MLTERCGQAPRIGIRTEPHRAKSPALEGGLQDNDMDEFEADEPANKPQADSENGSQPPITKRPLSIKLTVSRKNEPLMAENE
jgi:hypothetical protein